MDISANGGRVRLSRDVGAITMDLNGVEKIQLNAVGGADTITVNDLSGTSVTQVAIDLGAMPGNPGGDGQRDTVIANGTQADDPHQRRQQRRLDRGQGSGGSGVDRERRSRRRACRQRPRWQ